MPDAETKSPAAASRDLEKANSQPASVAISEENLAALMRATVRAAEPEVERPAEAANPVAVIDPNKSNAASPPTNLVESRLALFAAVKEKRAAISRSGPTPPTPLLDPPPASITPPAAPFEKPAPVQVPLPKTVPPVPEPIASLEIPSPIANRPTPSHNAGRSRLIIGLAAGAVIVTIGLSAFLTRTRPSEVRTVVASATKDNIPLQVRVEPQGKGLIEVRWNPQSSSIAEASSGRLVITEPNQKPRVLALEVGQLKTGHLMYQSAADSIQFDLEIAGRSGAIVKESVLALQSPANSPQPTAPPQTPPQQAATPTAQNLPNPIAAVPVPQVSQPVVRTFVPPAAQHNSEQRAIVDAPQVQTNGPVPVPEVGLTTPLAVISPPPTEEPAPQQVRVESNVEAANLVKNVIPIYPRIARSAGIQGTVRFTARIGKDGRILNLKFMSGPPVLVDAASAAVKQWVYRPTLLNGVPVEVITQIDVNFTLHENAH